MRERKTTYYRIRIGSCCCDAVLSQFINFFIIFIFFLFSYIIFLFRSYLRLFCVPISCNHTLITSIFTFSLQYFVSLSLAYWPLFYFSVFSFVSRFYLMLKRTFCNDSIRVRPINNKYIVTCST